MSKNNILKKEMIQMDIFGLVNGRSNLYTCKADDIGYMEIAVDNKYSAAKIFAEHFYTTNQLEYGVSFMVNEDQCDACLLGGRLEISFTAQP